MTYSISPVTEDDLQLIAELRTAGISFSDFMGKWISAGHNHVLELARCRVQLRRAEHSQSVRQVYRQTVRELTPTDDDDSPVRLTPREITKVASARSRKAAPI